MPSREPDAPESTLDRIMGERKDKADALARAGKNPYRNDLRPSHTIASVRDRYAGTHPLNAASSEITPVDGATVTVAGRVIAKRGFGKTVFAPIRDATGDLQLYLNVEHLDAADFADTLPLLDTGDIVLAEGVVFWTKRGEMSVLAKRLHILTKSLRPLPDKWHGLTDVEARYRQRYVDLAVAPEVREVFRKRSAIIRGIRGFLDQRSFLEVETPMMHPIIGGAAARPFVTHHNTLDMKLYLRIAPELYLKRLVVGGLERVYEINRNFRNEGIDRSHNPEFTMLEFYMAYATYADLMDLTEEMIAGLARDVNGGTKVTQDGVELELAAPWQRLTIREAVRKLGHVEDAARVFDEPLHAAEVAVARGVAPGEVLRVLAEGDLESSAEVKTLGSATTLDAAGLANVARRMVERYPNKEEARVRAGHLGYLVFEATAESHLVQPTFLTEFPVAVSPLARRSDADPAFCDRFELFVNGRELANAFSELNDPVDQRARFVAQLAARTAGAHETMDHDEDYCRALEVGMPPAAGEGVGIDRLAMLLTGQPSIRDVILFPLMRPE